MPYEQICHKEALYRTIRPHFVAGLYEPSSKLKTDFKIPSITVSNKFYNNNTTGLMVLELWGWGASSNTVFTNCRNNGIFKWHMAIKNWLNSLSLITSWEQDPSWEAKDRKPKLMFLPGEIWGWKYKWKGLNGRHTPSLAVSKENFFCT